MRACFLKLLIVAALLAVALVTTAQPPAGKCHVLLLDVSGSMKRHYENNLRGWLVEKLLTSAAFSPSDRVIVRAFNDQGSTAFDANDPLRKYNGSFQALIDEMEAAKPKIVGISRLRAVAHGDEFERWVIQHYEELPLKINKGVYIRRPE